MYERAEHLENLGNSHVRNFRTIHEAIATNTLGGNVSHYFELSMCGVVFYEGPTLTAGGFTDVPFVYLQHLLYPVGSVLNTALAFLKGTLTNLMIRYELIGWQGTGYLPRETAHLINPEQDVQTNRCVDPHITVSTQAVAETLVERRAEVLTDLMRPILWAFNYRADPDLLERMYQTLKELNLI